MKEGLFDWGGLFVEAVLGEAFWGEAFFHRPFLGRPFCREDFLVLSLKIHGQKLNANSVWGHRLRCGLGSQTKLGGDHRLRWGLG